MDAIDREILARLQGDGRITLTDLARHVQLSLSRCQRRVRDLEAAGVIQGYRAVVNPGEVGLQFEAIAFATLNRATGVTAFDDALAEVPEIIEAQRLFGVPDYILRIVAADQSAYQRLYDEVLIKLPGLRSLKSTIVMKQSVALRALPLKRAAKR
ncbi:Lrp/AsnC family transcriptional regulator [Paeniglutamicibacter psychrophenolicus]|uniref:DNA-binding Lrp family transcriptional regulator n=1 Tax=Paeniglutamicibacter psychrophenolicus TaxID=257454 RepID=A0ABS4WJV4_9MICC|nr:Lrp/AsnC family transcriptional regulator [Paeniglutamicibacter psychrophenolicus]MBP2376489.1 DNA-binding Lrp family transcriptional regulator [Paeniglutamicibacter psychrophenolicus]